MHSKAGAILVSSFAHNYQLKSESCIAPNYKLIPINVSKNTLDQLRKANADENMSYGTGVIGKKYTVIHKQQHLIAHLEKKEEETG